MTPDIPKILNQEDTIKYIIEYLDFKDDQGFSSYGYDLYIPNVMTKWCRDNMSVLGEEARIPQKLFPVISPYFFDASWELCRRGVLRPGIQSFGKQATDDGSAGNGYSVTPFGKKWLAESDKDTFVPTEPGRFAEMLHQYTSVFGAGFHERAQQAVLCYGAHAYLACCVMSGAAAESILLHLAITKDGDEEKILRLYRAANGRKALERMIVGGQKGGVKSQFEICFELLKYWRDEAAHGRKSDIGESEAYTSLGLLLRCALFAKDSHEMLTGKII